MKFIQFKYTTNLLTSRHSILIMLSTDTNVSYINAMYYSNQLRWIFKINIKRFLK